MASTVNSPSFGMRLIIRALKAHWSAVPTVTTETLQQWINEEPKQKPLVLLDARTPEEYQVSHLQGALLVDPQGKDVADTLHRIKDMYPDSSEVNAVSYCSLGYRGSLYVDAIQKAMSNKPDNVPLVKAYNLEGSLFKWANEGRPMVDSQDRPTKMAGACNFLCSKLLNSELLYTP